MPSARPASLSLSLLTSLARPSRLLALLPLVAALSLSPLIPFTPFASVALAANSGGTVQTVFGPPTYIGSYQGVSGPVTGGNVRIDSDFAGSVNGGFTMKGDATGNSVTISGGTVQGTVYGGTTGSGNATGNAVHMSGGTVSQNVYGGYADSGTVTGNTVTISGGTVTIDVNGGYTTAIGATAKGNSVTMSGGTVGGDVTGGYSQSGNATAKGNSVTMSGGTVTQNVYGGRASADGGTATGNSVTISGGTVHGNVYGGGGGDNATGNTVTLLGNPTFGGGTELWGGRVGNSTVTVAMSQDNTLNVFTSGLKAKSAQGFQYANFALFSGGGTGLELTSNAAFEAGAVVKAPVVLPGHDFSVGDTVSLLKVTGASGITGTPATPDGQARRGLALVYDYSLQNSGKEITATVTGRSLNPQTEALTESRAASMGAVTAGADLAAGKGLDSARAATNAAASSGISGGSGANGLGLIPFAAVQGGSWYTPAGGGTNASGMNILAGLAKRWNGDSADFLLGAFFEAGWGYNYGESKGIYADNKINSLGGGILARVDMTGTAARGLYAEFSARMGDMRQQWDSNYNEVTPFGEVLTAKYDKNSAYYGIHAGLGYVWDLSEALQLDLYAKYFWAQQTGFDARLAGDKFTFDTVNSHRVRAGGRLNFAVSESVKPYVGLAWEHEFDGKAGGSVYGLTLDSPTASGSTGIGELGLKITPVANCGFFMDLNVQGSLGTRQGVLGSVLLGYEF